MKFASIFKNNSDPEFNKLYKEFISLRDKLKDEHNINYPYELAEFGDFTWGNPQIMHWNQGTKLIVGKFCSIAPGTTILLGGQHHHEWLTTYSLLFEPCLFTKGNVVIGNDVWIGSGAKILSGVTIGDGCVVGANACVTKNMPPYSISGGAPAKIIKYRFSEEKIQELLRIKWWDWKVEDICRIKDTLFSSNIEELVEYYKNIQHL
jgi:acetyltransferase-like isoleucine patch superfamily enzyme